MSSLSLREDRSASHAGHIWRDTRKRSPVFLVFVEIASGVCESSASFSTTSLPWCGSSTWCGGPGVQVETDVSVTDLFVSSTGNFNSIIWDPMKKIPPRATFDAPFKPQKICSSSPLAKVCSCWLRADKSNVLNWPPVDDDKPSLSLATSLVYAKDEILKLFGILILKILRD